MSRRLHVVLAALATLLAALLLVALVGSEGRLSSAYLPSALGPTRLLGFLPSSAAAALGWLSSTHGATTPSFDARPARQLDPIDLVDPLVGTGGDMPNGSGGMVPSTAPPFAMTRWTAVTRENHVSSTPYNVTDTKIHGFQGTHQPAIWMGESGQCAIQAGVGSVKPAFRDRGLPFLRGDEESTATHYKVKMNAGGGQSVTGEHTSTSRVGHIRYSFNAKDAPFVVLQSTRMTVITSDPTNITSVLGGAVHIDPAAREISGRNPERQDWILGPSEAASFAGYYVARFSQPFASYGTANGAVVHEGETDLEDGTEIAGWAMFAEGTAEVVARVGTSFISIDQARRNLDREIPNGQTLEQTAAACRAAWSEKLDRIRFDGQDAEREDSKWLRVFYTAFWHSLQYPSEASEDGRYYSGYDDRVHAGESYTAYSIWDTFRAAWPWQILFAPERVGGIVTSMLQDYQQEGWLPMWKNVVETNIMIGTHADSLIASCVTRNLTAGFNLALAWEAVRKDADVPPDNDPTTQYADREENVGYEARAGLTLYREKGWVGDEEHSEAGSRTLAYAYDDYCTAVVARAAGDAAAADFYLARSQSYRTIFNNETGFMEARFANGSWAGADAGWTEGDKWCYTFDVMHDVPGLIHLVGGPDPFLALLDEHFAGAHNDHANEPSHHVPYLFSLAGRPSAARERSRAIALEDGDYGLGPEGLKGNEDLGQMSAWFLFTALGFYPVNPASAEYVLAAPLFSSITLLLPAPSNDPSHPPIHLRIAAPGAPAKTHVAGVCVNGRWLDRPVLAHADVLAGGEFFFDLRDEPVEWGGAHGGRL